MRLLDEHGAAIEADLLRFYRIDLLDLYRGTLSLRRLSVLVKQLPAESALVRALNGGLVPWGNVENLLADHWGLTDYWSQIISNQKTPKFRDHPTRAAKQEKAQAEAKQARLAELRAQFNKRKRIHEEG